MPRTAMQDAEHRLEEQALSLRAMVATISTPLAAPVIAATRLRTALFDTAHGPPPVATTT